MTLSVDDDPHACVRAFVDELARSGVTDACVCPGSRSTPLAMTLRRQERIRLWTHLDERAAAFFAMGMAKATRRPVAVLCTSGTAAVNFAPAVIEAWHARVPLLVLTADRPPELRDIGASQTIDQIRLYGSHVKWSVDLALPDTEAGARYARTAARRAVAIAGGDGVPGPVHLNFPFREPLVPTARPPAAAAATPDLDTWPSLSGLPDADLARLAQVIRNAMRGLIVCGPQDDPSFAPAVAGLAGRLQWPLLADALSGTRCGPHHSALVIDSYDTFLRDADTVRALEPDLIVRFGASPVSKALLGYLEHHRACRHLLIDPGLPRRWPDPTLTATDALAADAAAFCTALCHTLDSVHDPHAPTTGASSPLWRDRWHDIARRTRAALRHGLDGDGDLSEPAVFDELSTLLPDGATLFAGSSMPVRDLDGFFPGGPRHVHCLANRGASGIDGIVSTALGAAAAGRHPLLLVLGDLSFYHDMNGLLAARRHDLTAVIVLLNNDGGGIFSFLPQARDPQHFEELFGTPHGLDFRPVAELYGLRYRCAGNRREFRAACTDALGAAGTSVIEVRTRRDRNAMLHRSLWDGALAALHTAAPGGPDAGGASR